MTVETKQFYAFNDLECKSDDGDQYTFSGYLAVYNNVDQGLDVIMPGAFKDSLREWKKKGYYPPMLKQHGGFKINADDLEPIGKWTLMREDDKGLYVEGKLFSTTSGRNIWTVLKESDPGSMGMSIGYQARDYKYVEGKKYGKQYSGYTIRELNKINLSEGSVVTFPMNTEATIDAVKNINTLRDAEQFLREKGFSNKEAKDIVVQLKSIISADIDAEIKGIKQPEESKEAHEEPKETQEESVNISEKSNEPESKAPENIAEDKTKDENTSENTEEAKMDEELSAWLDEAIATKRKENAERETLEALEALLRK